MTFIAKNTKYPALAAEHDVQGTVRVKFIVEKDGSLTYPKIVDRPQGSGEASMAEVTAYGSEKERQDTETHNAGMQALCNEAIRVVNAMPKWTPGKHHGQVVRCYYVLPITYRLQ